MRKKTTVAVPAELMKDVKEYLVDIEDYDAGDLLQDCFYYAMEHLDNFEEYAEIYEEEGSEEEETEEEAESEED
jgi:hypothetical protein